MFPRRTNFPNSVKRAILKRANGICECHRMPHVPGLIEGGCGRPLSAGNTFFEHINPDGNGGAATIENGCALVRTCWKIKTHKYDQPLVAKTKRLFDRHHNINRKPSAPMPCGKNSGWKKPLNAWNAERRL